MNFNRDKNDQQKPAHQQQRRSIAEGMARTGIRSSIKREGKEKKAMIDCTSFKMFHICA
jgi:hypothetical protein